MKSVPRNSLHIIVFSFIKSVQYFIKLSRERWQRWECNLQSFTFKNFHYLLNSRLGSTKGNERKLQSTLEPVTCSRGDFHSQSVQICACHDGPTFVYQNWSSMFYWTFDLLHPNNCVLFCSFLSAFQTLHILSIRIMPSQTFKMEIFYCFFLDFLNCVWEWSNI